MMKPWAIYFAAFFVAYKKFTYYNIEAGKVLQNLL